MLWTSSKSRALRLNPHAALFVIQNCISHYIELFPLRKEFETVRSDFDSIETRERSKQLLLLQKKIKAYSWRIRHVESQLAYIAKVSGPDAARQNLIQTYVVSWSAPPDLAAILTKEELYQEAAKHLKEDIKKLLHNLAECDVKAVPCSKAELFNMLHTHYHPISGNRFHFDDLLESNWDSRIMPYREDTDLEESFTDELIDEMLYGGLQNG